MIKLLSEDSEKQTLKSTPSKRRCFSGAGFTGQQPTLGLFKRRSLFLPVMRYGWLQHLRSSIMVLMRLGMLCWFAPFDRKEKFFSKMAR